MIQFTRVADFSEAYASYDRNHPSGLIGIGDLDFRGAEGPESFAFHNDPRTISRIMGCV